MNIGELDIQHIQHIAIIGRQITWYTNTKYTEDYLKHIQMYLHEIAMHIYQKIKINEKSMIFREAYLHGVIRAHALSQSANTKNQFF